jgi:hypothetical protein
MKHAVSHLVIHGVTLVAAVQPSNEVDPSGEISGHIRLGTKKFFSQQRQCVIRMAKEFFLAEAARAGTICGYGNAAALGCEGVGGPGCSAV